MPTLFNAKLKSLLGGLIALVLAAFGMASSAYGQDVGFLDTNGSFSTISVPGSSGTYLCFGHQRFGPNGRVL